MYLSAMQVKPRMNLFVHLQIVLKRTILRGVPFPDKTDKELNYR